MLIIRFLPISTIVCFLFADLRKEAADKDTIDLGNGVIGFKFHNVTKYYENDIVLLSHETKHINTVPVELLDRVEGLIVYFDSDNVSKCTFQRLNNRNTELMLI